MRSLRPEPDVLSLALGLAAAAFLGSFPARAADLDWRAYIAGPSVRLVEAATAEVAAMGDGSVTQPGYAAAEDGLAAAITRAGPSSPELAVDFGLPVSGKIEIVFGATVTADLGIAFSQRREFLRVGSDTDVWCLGDVTVRGRPGLTWRTDARRGFRYALLYLPADGTVTVDAVRVYHTPYLGTPDTYDGHFLSNDDLLNRVWYGCVYTQEICTTVGMGCDGPWEIEEGWMSVSWDREHEFGLSVPGSDWTDYAFDFDVVIMPLGKGFGWCFRAPDEANGHMWHITASQNGAPATLSRNLRYQGGWIASATFPLSVPIREGEAHHVRTELDGPAIRVYLGGGLIDAASDAAFPSGRIGFRVDPSGEHFHVDNVTVASGTGKLFVDRFDGDSPVLDRRRWQRAKLLTINDGAKRDRYWYGGDFYPAQRTMFSAHWLPGIVADTLRDGAQHQYTEDLETETGEILAGKIPASSALDYMIGGGHFIWIDDYALWWALTLHDYWMRTGDETLLIETYPALRRLFERWAIRKHTADGLLSLRLGDWYWSFLRQGEVTYLNALYVIALRGGAEIADRLGETGDAAAWSARADSVAEAVNAHLFDATAGLYVDGRSDRLHFPLDANTFAILSGIADRDRAAAILDRIEERMWSPLGTTTSWPPYDTWGHNDQIWTWYVQYETEARFLLNDDARAFETIRRPWGHMVESDPTRTMWEFIMADGTVENGIRNTDHAFSAGAAWLLSEYVAGIRPAAPGFAAFDMIPHPGGLEWVECTVPSPLGPFAISYRVGPSRKTWHATIDLPGGTTGRVAVPRLGLAALVEIDGRMVWGPSGPTGDASADGFHLFFPGIGPGQHSVEAWFDEEIPSPAAAPLMRVR